MGCCTEKLDVVWERKPATSVDRRGVLKASAGLAGLALASGTTGVRAQEAVKLAFCSQLLCVTPYEFTRAAGFFEEEGLSVELVYARGGNAAMQAMVGGAVDYAATSFDVAVQAFANGADIRRFATTGRLPLFALAVAPGRGRGHRVAERPAGQDRRGLGARQRRPHAAALPPRRGGRRRRLGQLRGARAEPLRGAAPRPGRGRAWCRSRR